MTTRKYEAVVKCVPGRVGGRIPVIAGRAQLHDTQLMKSRAYARWLDGLLSYHPY
jgi:hypothetical protein